MEKIKQIIWDWNGTLLDDVSMCVKVMNDLLKKYNLPELTCEKYKNVFGFPVKDYYKRIGFDFENISFDVVGHEFMARYFKELPNTPLFDEVPIYLDGFKTLGINQLVLSAMEHNALEESLINKGIRSYFSIVQGIDNHLADGKVALAKGLIEQSGFSAQESLLIGDTVHDFHVAQSIGSQCALIANGHFSKERLLMEHDVVFDTLADFKTQFMMSNINF